ncbi:MAG: 3-dehydroquinate synthase [Spirochaetes bacterium]|nr:MAG: 3-dehydroquinate synthase [Spirochaetota bacterium]
MAASSEDYVKEDVLSLSLRNAAKDFDPKRTILISDRSILALHGEAFTSFPTVVVPEGERSKSWDILALIFTTFLEYRVDRTWKVFALGGGSVSDIGGFAAHLWMRGIGFSIAPTTLLAMVDAGLGGKNGIDFGGFKNVLGSFQKPEKVYCDMDTLRTLGKDQFISGMAEAIKHGIIDGEGYFSFLESLHPFDHKAADFSILAHIVKESQRIKLDIVEADPREKGQRRVLNLGHTFGHGIETHTGMPHGHAVSIGIAIACSLSLRRGTLKASDFYRILGVLAGWGLPTSHEDLLYKEFRVEIVHSMQMDKKRAANSLYFVLPKGIGKVEIEKLEVDSLATFFTDGLFLNDLPPASLEIAT